MSVSEFSSLYNKYTVKNKISAGKTVRIEDLECLVDTNSTTIDSYIHKIGILNEADIFIPDNVIAEISHHYGIEKFKSTDVLC